MLVDSAIIGGAIPELYASSHLLAHKHHFCPGNRPGKSYCGIGVDKSFPTLLEKTKNSSVSITQTVWIPLSLSPVSQHPFL